jgi:TonB-dependent starch-binding outer membrane protein SusC
MHMRKVLMLMLGLFVLCTQLHAQNRTITGRITDESGAGVPNATVRVKGGNLGTTTANDGTYSLTVPANTKTLIVSSVGFAERELSVGTNTVANTTLSVEGRGLEEVVVVGYQQRKKIDEAGAISSIKAGDIENLPVASLDKAMQGKAAGVVVQSNNGIPGGSITVRIRGYGSLSAGNAPLYVVDGVQMNTGGTNTFTQSNPLAYLNPNDIESIDILKDAASSAIYGASASNGVVIITTKKGRAGKTKFNFNTYYGYATRMKKLDMTNSQEYIRLRLEAYGNANNLPYNDLAVKRTVLSEVTRLPTSTFTTWTDKMLDSAFAATKTYDWQEEAFRNGKLRNYELSASGGNDKTTFRISANYNIQEAILSASDFNRKGLNINLSNKATDKLTLSTQANLSSFLQKGPFGGSGGSSLGNVSFASSAILPFNPFYNANGTFYGIPGQTPSNLAGTLNQNALAVNAYDKIDQKNNQLVGNFSADYKILDWLSFRSFYGLDYRNTEANSYWDPRTGDGSTRGGLKQAQSAWNTNFLTNQVLSANHTFASKHNVDGLIGYEYRKEDNRQIFVSSQGFPTPEFRTLGSAALNSSFDETSTGYRTQSVFSSLNYNFDGRYLLGLVGRYQGSSRFGANNEYGFFPGIKVAWNISKENFMEPINAITDLRVRFGYGKVGNDQIGNFDSRGLYGGGSLYSTMAGMTYSQLENADLSWEGNTTTNIGLDFGLFKNRIFGAFEVYNRKTTELLIDQQVAWTSGFSSITSNVGEVENKGYEVTLNAKILQPKTTGRFSWNTMFVLGYNKSKLLKLYGNAKNLGTTTYQIGKPLFLVQTAPYAGVNPATGRAMWYDTLGNLTYQVQTRDNRIIGDELPEYTGGLTNSFSFKGFSLDVFFQYEFGRLVSDGQVNFLSEASGRINFMQYIYDRRWTTPGQITDVPRMNLNTESKNSGVQAGSRMWFKGDYVRLKTVTLSYDLPQSVVKKIRMNNVQFYVQGTNLYTFADLPSYDPEFLGGGTGQIPQPRNMTVGLQIGF